VSYLDALAAALTIGLASVAAWRVIAVDAVTAPLRRRLYGETGVNIRDSRLMLWLHTWQKCPWCAGAWITAAVTVAVDATVGLPKPLLVFAAARYVTGWVGSRDADYHEQTMRGEP
jgi:hypothetical protein